MRGASPITRHGKAGCFVGVCVIAKGIVADLRLRIRQRHTAKRGAAERHDTDALQALGQHGVGELSGVLKSACADLGHALGYADTEQLGVGKRVAADGFQAVGQPHRRHAAKIGKRLVADVGHAVPDHQLLDMSCLLKPRRRGAFIIIRHRAAAADRQPAVVIRPRAVACFAAQSACRFTVGFGGSSRKRKRREQQADCQQNGQ